MGRPVLILVLGACLVAGVVAAAASRSITARPEPVAAQPAAPVEDGPRIQLSASESPKVILPGGREEAILSVLNIREPMRYGGYRWDEAGVPEGQVWVRVDVARQLISVFRGGHEIGSAVILYGAESKPTPMGWFTVLQKAQDYHSYTYDAPMPFMLRLTADGVAIHGSEVREGSATHGCIGVPLAFARLVFAQMKLGDPVVILNTSESPGIV